MSYEVSVISGTVGRDPEMRYMPNGTAVTNFSLAVDAGYGDKKYTKWVRVSCFGKLAESVSSYVRKGSKHVIVQGSYTGDPETGGPRVWTGKDGQAKASFELKADRVVFGTKTAEQETTELGYSDDAMAEDDIPF